MVGWLCMVEDRQKIYANRNYWQPWPWIALTAYTFILTIYPYLSCHSTEHLLFSSHSTVQQNNHHRPRSKIRAPSNTSPSPSSSLSPLFFVSLRQVLQASRSSQLKLRLRLPPSSSMEHSHQLQHRHPGSMLKEAASLTTLSTLSTTNSSFILGLQVFFMKSLGRNLSRALYFIGAAPSPSLT